MSELGEGHRVKVKPFEVPRVVTDGPVPTRARVVPAFGPPGPKGDTGDQGPEGDTVVDWFTGDGPPPAVIDGAGAGDMYVDRLTGDLYQLR